MADTLSSKTRAGGPFGIGNAYLEDSAVPLATLQMQNQSAIRNKPINPALASALQDAVTRTYGSGYTISVMSGAQKEGPRGTTGSRRHGTGDAADIVVRDPDGRSLTPNQLLPLARQWLASDTGSVGFPADGTNFLHLDLVGGSGDGAIPLQKGEGRLWYYGSPDNLQRRELTAALNGDAPPLPPMNIPDVGSALAYVPDAPQPGSLNSALQAIQQNAPPSNWNDFYTGLLPTNPAPIAGDDYAQLTTPQSVLDWYSNFGLPPASNAPSLADYATITTPQQASDFYSDFGLPAASAPPSVPQITNQAQAADFYSDFGLPAAPSADAAQIQNAQDAANFYDGFGLSPASSPQVASADTSVLPSILPSAWPQLPPSLTTSPDAAAGDRAAAPIPPSVLPSTWPTIPVSGNTNVGTFQDIGSDGSISLFQPRSVALPAGVRPNVPSTTPDMLPPKTPTGNPLASLFASSVPASLTAPTLDSATAFGQSPMTTAGFSVPSVSQAVSRGGAIEAPSIIPTSLYASAPAPAAAPTLDNAFGAIYGGAPSYSHNSANLTPAADLTSLSVPQSVSVPKYIAVSRQVPIPASQPIETGSGVHWDAAQNNFVLDDTPAPSTATQYRTVSERVLNPAYTTPPTAMPRTAVMPQPVTPLSPPQGELGQLRQDAMNPLQRLFSMTPAGHVWNFMSGADAAYGAPQTGGILQAIARSNGGNPLASLFGLGNAPSVPTAANSAPAAAFGVNGLGQALNSSTRTPALPAGATGTAGGYIYQSNGDGTYTNIGRASNWNNSYSGNSGDGSYALRSLTQD